MGSVAIWKTRASRAASVFSGTVCVVALAGCGSEEFRNEPRPARPETLTGVISKDKVTISPNRFGAGPIELTISNQTDEAHTVTLEGGRLRERVGPVNPLDTATIQASPGPGRYEVRAGSFEAVPEEIQPATLDVGERRQDSNDDLLLP
ncbi:MAG: hypothetical protein M3375_00095 [Actinomycetota bacterium]|nr:hypothetical protein [Actinomycetota bacterium]